MTKAVDLPLPEGDEKRRAVRSLFDTISGRYDLVNRVMTLGMDVGWRRRAVKALRLPGEALVMDLACGTGDLCSELQRNGYRTIGFDFSHGMLVAATTDAPLVEADVLRLPVRDGGADGVTCGFALRNVVDLASFFTELGRVVRSGGRIALLDASEPDNRVMRAGHRVYFRQVVPRIGALLSDAGAYAYLPRSMAYLPDPAAMVSMLREAGFPDAERVQLSGGITQLLTRDPDVSTPLDRVRAERLGPAFDLLAGYAPGGCFMERSGIGVAGLPFPDTRPWLLDLNGPHGVDDLFADVDLRGLDPGGAATDRVRLHPFRTRARRPFRVPRADDPSRS